MTTIQRYRLVFIENREVCRAKIHTWIFTVRLSRHLRIELDIRLWFSGLDALGIFFPAVPHQKGKVEKSLLRIKIQGWCKKDSTELQTNARYSR